MQKQVISASANMWISEKQNGFWTTFPGHACILQLHQIVHPFSSWNSCDTIAQLFLSFLLLVSRLDACIFDNLTLSCFFCFLLTLCTCSAAFYSSVLIPSMDSLADRALWRHLQEEWFSMYSQWTPENPQIIPNSSWEVVKKIKSTVSRVKCSV